jgi:hypothetical protein
MEKSVLELCLLHDRAHGVEGLVVCNLYSEYIILAFAFCAAL